MDPVTSAEWIKKNKKSLIALAATGGLLVGAYELPKILLLESLFKFIGLAIKHKGRVPIGEAFNIGVDVFSMGQLDKKKSGQK